MIAIMTGCRILVDSVVNEYMNQITVKISGEHNIDRIVFYSVL